MSNPPAPTQRRVWRSWFFLRRKPRRVSQHPVGHRRDRSGITRTLRTCFILPCMTSSSSEGAPALCRRCQLGAARVSFGLRYRGSSAGARARRVPSASRCWGRPIERMSFELEIFPGRPSTHPDAPRARIDACRVPRALAWPVVPIGTLQEERSHVLRPRCPQSLHPSLRAQ
jgi:hypothetical protein